MRTPFGGSNASLVLQVLSTEMDQDEKDLHIPGLECDKAVRQGSELIVVCHPTAK